MKTALAIGAHPDDIEFHMAGTLLLLKKAGYQIHYFNVASGNCGSAEYTAATTRSIRNTEARAAAALLGAEFHPSITDDLEITYRLELLRPIAALIRTVKPEIVLTHSQDDYMEDHTCTCRLAVTAAFARGMPNFRTVPPRPAAEYSTTLYHCMPHGLRDPLGREVYPGSFVNTGSVHALKHKALAQHKSQQRWLDKSQGMNCYLLAMEDMSLELGRMSKKFKHAEAWRRHFHLGFCEPDADPLAEVLGANYLLNPSQAPAAKPSQVSK